MKNIESLLQTLPKFDTPALSAEWGAAHNVFRAVDAVNVFRAMSIGTRRILFQTLRAMNAKDVLDLGTYNGTSALCFALACTHGRVVTVDVVDANAPDGYWAVDGLTHSPQQLMDKAGVKNVEFVTQDATAYLRSTADTFDMICIDASKSEEDTYDQMPLAVARLNPGGLIFMDDVFADGVPMPSGYYDVSHWNVLQRYHGVLNPVLLTKTLEGARIACAWVLRA